RVSSQYCQEMRFTSAVRAIVRSREDAIKDMNIMKAITQRLGPAAAEYQPANAQSFSVSNGPRMDQQDLAEALYRPKGVVHDILDRAGNPKWFMVCYFRSIIQTSSF
ncbi:hypothetical protein PENTCL1PPCAC_10326, partial [Pristionchus entomophagus]